MNEKDLPIDPKPGSGFIEIVCTGKLSLFAQLTCSVLQPNYNAALGSGNEHFAISRKRNFYLVAGSAITIANWKQVKKKWRSKKSEMEAYKKKHGLSLSREKDLIQLINYFNSLE